MQCYSCEGDLAPKQSAAPSGVIGAPVEPGQESEASQRRYEQLLEESHAHRKSNWKHGLRAGAAAGAFTGVFYGLFLGFFGTLLGSVAGQGHGLQAELAGAAIGGLLVFGIAFTSQLLYTVFIGFLCGVLDVLCYQRDSARIGSYIGLAWGIVNLLTGGGGVLGIFWSMGWGSATGWMVSFAEKSWFRKQYAELN